MKSLPWWLVVLASLGIGVLGTAIGLAVVGPAAGPGEITLIFCTLVGVSLIGGGLIRRRARAEQTLASGGHSEKVLASGVPSARPVDEADRSN